AARRGLAVLLRSKRRGEFWFRLARRVPASAVSASSGFGLQTRRGWEGGSAILRPTP
uniref:Uncharacterized protein n=1 Tax=Cucumis melo TaxID=3656 RepID=A0A9I9CD76_CUCME